MADRLLYADTLVHSDLRFNNATFAGSMKEGVSGALTAFATGGQTNALPLIYTINRLGTVGTAADSVRLPVSVPGMHVVIINESANSAQVFGAGTDTINAVATGTGVALAAGKVGIYYCTAAGLWRGGALA